MKKLMNSLGKYVIQKKVVVVGIFLFFLLSFFVQKKLSKIHNVSFNNTTIISGAFDETRERTNAEWKKILTPIQYHILREKGTEIPFSGSLDNEIRKGTYYSVGCNKPIFRSEQKYDSRTGWPSFWGPISREAVILREDDSILGEARIEVLDTCGGHLGHMFDDGPLPTGKRYCINSVALVFIPDKIQ